MQDNDLSFAVGRVCASRRPCNSIYINLPGPHPRLTRPSVPVYDTGADLPRPHRFTMPRPTHLSELPLMLRSFLSSVSRGLVYINIPGRTCLHELFIGRTSRRHYSFD